LADLVALDLVGQPLVDRDDFENLFSQGTFGRWSEQARSMRDYGFCLLDLKQPTFVEKCQQLRSRLASLLADDIELWQRGESGPPRLQDGWLSVPQIRALCLLPEVLEVLSHLYGRKPIPFQSLNFAIGSQQPVHSDAVHFHAYPYGFMCGVWIALEDVKQDSGPLMYYPSSHRLAYFSAEDLHLTPEIVKAEKHPQTFFQGRWDAQIATGAFSKQLFYPKCGEILIWHANLLHGGEGVQDRHLTRWSQVNHYYFEDCLYTTPIHSYAATQGGCTLRNPYNIGTKQRVYSASSWRDLDVCCLGQASSDCS
jgi:hypothetical protein